MAAPRLAKPATVNEILQDRAVRHQLYLERFKTHEQRRILSFLNKELYPALVQRVESRLRKIRVRGFDPGPVTTRRLVELQREIGTLIGKQYRQARSVLGEDLTGLADHEAEWQHRLLADTVPVEITTVMPTPAQLRGVVFAKPFEGALLREWFDTLGATTQRQVAGSVRIGIAAGETNEQIVRRLRGTAALGYRDGVLEGSRREIESVVRTAVQHVSAATRETTFAENADLIEGVQWVATLDTRTCPVCMALDGQVYKQGDGQRPPAHWQCRCTIVPVLKSWKALGINLRDAPEGTRAAMGGKVPESMTYGAWLRKQSAAIQDDALGATRGRLFRSGGLEVGDFVSERSKTLTLSQLRRVEAQAFAEAGL